MQFESVTGTVRSIIDVQSIPFRVELFRLSGDPHDHVRFERRKRVFHAEFGRQVFISTPEDVIITKLRWAEEHRTRKVLDEIRASIPEI